MSSDNSSFIDYIANRTVYVDSTTKIVLVQLVDDFILYITTKCGDHSHTKGYNLHTRFDDPISLYHPDSDVNWD